MDYERRGEHAQEKGELILNTFAPLLGAQGKVPFTAENAGNLEETLHSLQGVVGSIQEKYPDSAAASHMGERMKDLVKMAAAMKEYNVQTNSTEKGIAYREFTEAFNRVIGSKDGKSFQQDMAEMMIETNFTYSYDSPYMQNLDNCITFCEKINTVDRNRDLDTANRKFQEKKAAYDESYKNFQDRLFTLQGQYAEDPDEPTAFSDMYNLREIFTDIQNKTHIDFNGKPYDGSEPETNKKLAEERIQSIQNEVNGTVSRTYKSKEDRQAFMANVNLLDDAEICAAIDGNVMDYLVSSTKDDNYLQTHKLTEEQKLQRDTSAYLAELPELEALRSELKGYNDAWEMRESYRHEMNEAKLQIDDMLSDNDFGRTYEQYQKYRTDAQLKSRTGDVEFADKSWNEYLNGHDFANFPELQKKQNEMVDKMREADFTISQEMNKLGGMKSAQEKANRLQELEQRHSPEATKKLQDRLNAVRDKVHMAKSDKIVTVDKLMTERKQEIEFIQENLASTVKGQQIQSFAKEMRDKLAQIRTITPESIGKEYNTAFYTSNQIKRDLNAYNDQLRNFDDCLYYVNAECQPKLKEAAEAGERVTQGFQSDGYQDAQKDLQQIAAHINDNKRPLHRNTAEFTRMADGLQDIMKDGANLSAKEKMDKLKELRTAAMEYQDKKLGSGRAADASSMRNTRLLMAKNIYNICDRAINSMELNTKMADAQAFLGEDHSNVKNMSAGNLCNMINPNCTNIKAHSDTLANNPELMSVAGRSPAPSQSKIDKENSLTNNLNKSQPQKKQGGMGMGGKS